MKLRRIIDDTTTKVMLVIFMYVPKPQKNNPHTCGMWRTIRTKTNKRSLRTNRIILVFKEAAFAYDSYNQFKYCS